MRLKAGLMMVLLLSLSGCRQSLQLSHAPSAWKQAIRDDSSRPCQMEVQIQQPHSEQLPALLEVYRPHPDYLVMVERGADTCMIGGKVYRPITYITAQEQIRWNPMQRRCTIVPRLPDQQGEARIRQLFERNVRLREVEQAEWQGKRWTVVEAWVPNGYLRKHYWIASSQPPYVGRVQTYNSAGQLLCDEQRFQYRILPGSPTSPMPPAPPADWQIVRPAQILPAELKMGFKLRRYQPPDGYEQIMVLKRTCPCGGNHLAIGALYSNGLDSFTLFWLPAVCPDAQRADRQLRLRQQPEGITATIRLPDGTALLLVGELQPRHAAEMLTD
jgi:hypothetical protein